MRSATSTDSIDLYRPTSSMQVTYEQRRVRSQGEPAGARLLAGRHSFLISTSRTMSAVRVCLFTHSLSVTHPIMHRNEATLWLERKSVPTLVGYRR